MDMSIFKDGRVHLWNSGVTGLKYLSQFFVNLQALLRTLDTIRVIIGNEDILRSRCEDIYNSAAWLDVNVIDCDPYIIEESGNANETKIIGNIHTYTVSFWIYTKVRFILINELCQKYSFKATDWIHFFVASCLRYCRLGLFWKFTTLKEKSCIH